LEIVIEIARGEPVLLLQLCVITSGSINTHSKWKLCKCGNVSNSLTFGSVRKGVSAKVQRDLEEKETTKSTRRVATRM